MLIEKLGLTLIPTWFKNVTYLIAAFIGLEYDAFSAFALLMLIDVITGVLAAARVNGWRSITSRRLSFGLISKLLLLIIPITIALAGRASGVDIDSVVNTAFFVLTISELYSVIGNIQTVKTGVRIPEFDAISIILASIRRFLKKIPFPPG